MMSLDSETIRKVLFTAREHGFAEVKLRSGGDSFAATLAPTFATDADQSPVDLTVEASHPNTIHVKAPSVGYFREAKKLVKLGSEVEAGSSFGDVLALGIANDIPFPSAGTLKAVLIKSGEPVEYGQILAEIEIG